MSGVLPVLACVVVSSLGAETGWRHESQARRPTDAPRDDVWLPVQGDIAGTGAFSTAGGGSLGITLYLGIAYGRTHVGSPWLARREGFFGGLGGVAFFGTADSPSCFGALRCAARRWGGLAARVGYAFHDRDDDPIAGTFRWPDAYVYAQLGGFLGGEAVGTAPLSPATFVALRGLRVELGITCLALSRFFAHVWLEVLPRRLATAFLGIFVAPLILLNHFAVHVEVSNAALSPGGLRFGLALGGGF